MWADIQHYQQLRSSFSRGLFTSLELVDPLGSWNEGAWQMTPFNGEGVNDNAAMRVGTDPASYQTTGGYALYPGVLPSCKDGHEAPCS
ncbi:hypothetical protein GUITHDRAFT_150722 [Guillardia theta CCMP2712]|uniref:Uncharacterized protein n=2 Tax=Guillardia theta TaxID=55529 RepID=L1JUG8_GUITC|nr:hypothetical protein GUITHDRAFT_150722 [Guillardia theta CCMP2712]EKX52216.1 hypothetical protein GUITHDRAFT_150722 [Guillardia theta CCMP2712]|eukprot:XP_005839196.1 hypothetical protein GUITHDRAFT_150722 [Guillardia theta CCMP2712]